jgi:hypothetical protein
MGAFDEALALALATEGVPDGLLDGLLDAHTADLTASSDLAAAKITGLETAAGETNTVIAGLKTQLYDLMTASAATDAAGPDELGVPDEAKESYDDDADEDGPDIDSFFTTDNDTDKDDK